MKRQRRAPLALSAKKLFGQGFAVVKGMHSSQKAHLKQHVCEELKALVLKAHKSHPRLFLPIFEKFTRPPKGSDEEPTTIDDANRLQVSVEALRKHYAKEHASLFEALDEFVAQVLRLIAKHRSDYVVDLNSAHFLLSLPSTKGQMLHTDYDAESAFAFQTVVPEKPPLFIMSPIADPMSLRIAEGPPGSVLVGRRGDPKGFHFRVEAEYNVKLVELPWDSVLVVHGYTPHAGCSYDAVNVRLHFYVFPKAALAAINEGRISKVTGTLFEEPVFANDL